MFLSLHTPCLLFCLMAAVAAPLTRNEIFWGGTSRGLRFRIVRPRSHASRSSSSPGVSAGDILYPDQPGLRWLSASRTHSWQSDQSVGRPACSDRTVLDF